MNAVALRKLLLVTAIYALAVPVLAQNANTPTAPMLTSADFAWDAGLINLKEIRLGEAAQSNSQNTAVQEFGRHMVRDHSRMQQHLEKVAADEGLQLPDTNTFNTQLPSPEEKPATEMMPETPQQKLLAAQLDVQHMTSLTGTDFDRAYADAMVKGHDKAIQEFEDASGSLDDKALKKYADKGLKTIRHHYEMAQKLQDEVSPGANAPASSSPPM